MSLQIHHVDAFTDRPFAGNPAAVCVLPAARDEGWMQRVAMEMNLSETAFLVQRDGSYDLRWFTPVAEVDLCGHATLASAHVLWETGRLSPHDPARFDTRSGRLTCTRRGDWIEMDFPAQPASPCQAPSGLLEALGCQAVSVGANRLHYLVELELESVLRGLAPDFHALRRFDPRRVIVTAPASTSGIDFVSRYFAPSLGIDEDPVTGSAHCCLGPYWSARLGRDELIGFQASRRGGAVRVRVGPDQHVMICGQAVTVIRADLISGMS